MLPAWEPVKKVLIPKAASVPLVSVPKANCVLAAVDEMVSCAVGDLGRQAADAVDFRGQAVERRVVAGAQQGDGNVGRGARARLRVRDDDLKRTVGRREAPGRPGSSGALGLLTALRLVVCV